MPTIVKLPVPYFAQEQGYYCGPACAKMILASMGTSWSQDALWATIKAKSTGTRPADVPETPGHFPSQQCDFCGKWHCWDTHPEALSACLNAHGPWAFDVITRYTSTIDETILALIDSIDSVPATPACASFYAVNHWVAITGYHLDDLTLTGAAPYQVGSLNLNGIYFHNPNVADPTGTVNWLPTVQFRMVLGPISCGAHLDRYPIVVASWWGVARLLARARAVWNYLWRGWLSLWS